MFIFGLLLFTIRGPLSFVILIQVIIQSLNQYWLQGQYSNLIASRKILYEQSHLELSSYRSPVTSEIFCSRKTGVRVGYTLCTIPSVKIYATREWSCDYVSLYPASIRGIRRELPFGDIRIDECKSVVCMCFEQEHYCEISQRVLKKKRQKRGLSNGSLLSRVTKKLGFAI